MGTRSPNDWEWDRTDDITEARARKKFSSQQRQREERKQGFECGHCSEWVPIYEEMGTHNRNHCPHCLWSKHVDDQKPGDRKSDCREGMKPVALTFKGEAEDKYAQRTERERQVGELMLVHECVRGDQIRINRIAADDSSDALLGVFYASHELPPEVQLELAEEGITIAPLELVGEVTIQLFGQP
jgi:hypothetical protein